MDSSDIHTSDKRPFDELSLQDIEEQKVIFATLDSFRQYRRSCHYNITHRRRQNLYALPKDTWNVLASPPINLLEKFSAVDDAIDHNADLADAILQLGIQFFGLSKFENEDGKVPWHNIAKPSDMSKVHSTIRQFYRDWSDEGFKTEVEPLLKIALRDLQQCSPGLSATYQPHVLLPGAGLGRLLFELCRHGYAVEGNEISYHQLLASNFILNCTERPAQYKIFPFATTFTNHVSRNSQTQEFLIPDIHPGAALNEHRRKSVEQSVPHGMMNMTAGDFLTSYSDPGSQSAFDAVLTVYFIDTAPNLIRYIQTVKHCLKVGGIWINIGPLLWHFDDRRLETGSADTQDAVDGPRDKLEDSGIAEPGSFELAEEEVLLLVTMSGFELVEHEMLPESLGGYIQDLRSMIQSRYRCSHWVARKTADG